MDFGAGYGLFVRMMRDNGYNFYWYDAYCTNIFASKFSSEDLPKDERHYQVVTAFEVFEHFVDPLKEIEKILCQSEGIFFSTELVNRCKTEIENWWYISPNHGQHVAFYDIKTLGFIAQKLELNLYSHKNLHFLSKKKVNKFAYDFLTIYKIARLFNTIFTPRSLIVADQKLYLGEQ